MALIAMQSGMYKAATHIIENSEDKETVAHRHKGTETSCFLHILKKFANDLGEETTQDLRDCFDAFNIRPTGKMHYGTLLKDGELSQAVQNKLASVLYAMPIDQYQKAAENTQVVMANEQFSPSYSAPNVDFATGFGDGEVGYSGGNFIGYNHAHMAILRYGKELVEKPDLISLLLSLKSEEESGADNIKLGTGELDGLSFYNILTNTVSISDSGEWNVIPPTVSVGGGTEYEIYAKYGNVKDLTGGGKANNLGPVNNILNQFHGLHTKLYNESDKSTSANGLPNIETKFNNLVSSILPGITFPFYVIWCVHFNKDIS